MAIKSTLLLAVSVPLLWAAAPAPALNATSTDTPRLQVLTGKERLNGKATDEQRVNDCKVPPELRGTKTRPSACGPKATGKKKAPAALPPAN